MSGNTREAEDYSTNPNTVKARRRKMKLNGAKKVEDAARTADYKAMIYARKVVQAKEEYKTASDSEKSAMLEKAMRDTMTKRRARGQDTMSKMAAFEAGMYEHRPSITGPQTRVPISAFLEDNGFVPSRPSRKGGAERHNATSDPINNTTNCSVEPVTPNSFVSAPEADMTGIGNTFARANGLPSFRRSRDHTSTNGYSPHNRQVEIPAPPRRSPSLFKSQSRSLTAPATKPEVLTTPAPFGRMTPEPLIPSIEDGPPDSSSSDGDCLSMLRMEVVHLRTICQNVLQSNSNLRDLDLRNVRAEMGIEKNRVTELDRRVGQLEGIVHALHNTSLTAVVERLTKMEELVDELQDKVGSGAEAEVAKMREVMGCMKEALDRVGGF
ncbi:hypothetical protein SLS53_006639 [Cytospora paraplurivora]|uniref:Uncharacterized protein n=1 Tax=Cytospora paraplurivora TaxID=2898453 RepID=A0AAN9YEJ9_9PEZI